MRKRMDEDGRARWEMQNSKEDFSDRREKTISNSAAGGDDQQVEAPSGADSSNTLSSIIKLNIK
eukprot:SAG31_NODE_183_length_20987_cov_8.711078_6_plen_64_part_00